MKNTTRFFSSQSKNRLPVALLGGFLFFLVLGIAVRWSITSTLDELRRDGTQKLTLYRKVLGNELKRYQYLPLALAKNTDIISFLQSPPLSRLPDHLNLNLEEINDQTETEAIYLMDTEGLTVASSNWRRDTSYVGHNYSFRPYFQQSRSGVPGRYFAIGATTKRPGLFLSHPVRNKGEILGVVAIKISLEYLEQEWAKQGPEELLVADADGVIFTSSEPSWKLCTLSTLSPEVQSRLLGQRKYLNRDIPTLAMTPLSWPGVTDLIRIAPRETTPTYYLHQSLGLHDNDWTIHHFSDLVPVRDSLINVLAICGPTSLALTLLFFYLIDYRRYLAERQDYQRRIQEGLRISAKEKRAIIDHTQAALIIIDSEGMIESFNPTAERFFGYKEAEVKRENVTLLLDTPKNFSFFKTKGAQEVNGGRNERFEAQGRCKDGSTLTMDVTISDIKLHRGERFIVTIQDITRLRTVEKDLRVTLDEQEERIRRRTTALRATNEKLQHEIAERRRTETELRETQNDLIQASKLAALGQMSAGISHELNQPLAATRTFAASGRLLLQKGDLVEAEKNFARIFDLTHRMGKITSHLKTFARKSSGRLQPVSVSSSLSQALSLLDQSIRLADVKVALTLPERSLCVSGDAVRLEQVLINLLSNALDAMEGCRTRSLEIEVQEDGAVIRLVIRDSGPGIAETDIDRIFDPFFTTKEVGKGLGLGLSITYGIIRDWGGTIRAGNHNSGAEFIVELPAVPDGKE